MASDEFENINERVFVLKISLKLEHSISEYLAQLLNVSDVKKSYSFGNKSSTLSFNQKVNLLIDINALESDKRNVLVTFMEIRNQFMHNIHAINNVECIKQLDGKESFLLKRYRQDAKLSLEKQLGNAIVLLCQEALNVTGKIVGVINNKVVDQAVNNVTSRLAFALIQSDIIVRNEFDEYIDKVMDKTFTGKEVKQLYHEYSGKIFKKAQEKVSEENDKKAMS